MFDLLKLWIHVHVHSVYEWLHFIVIPTPYAISLISLLFFLRFKPIDWFLFFCSGQLLQNRDPPTLEAVQGYIFYSYWFQTCQQWYSKFHTETEMSCKLQSLEIFIPNRRTWKHLGFKNARGWKPLYCSAFEASDIRLTQLYSCSFIDLILLS